MSPQVNQIAFPFGGVSVPGGYQGFVPQPPITPVIPGGAVWRFNPLIASSYFWTAGGVVPLPIVPTSDYGDPNAPVTLDRVYLPFVATFLWVSGVVGDLFQVTARGRIGTVTAFVETIGLQPLYNIVTQAGIAPAWAIVGAVDVSPGVAVQPKQRLAVELTISSNFLGTVQAMLATNAVPSLAGWAGSTLDTLQIENGNAFAQFTTP